MTYPRQRPQRRSQAARWLPLVLGILALACSVAVYAWSLNRLQNQCEHRGGQWVQGYGSHASSFCFYPPKGSK